MKENEKRQIWIKKIITYVSVACLIAYMCFMREESKLITYGYFFLEIGSIAYLFWGQKIRDFVTRYNIFVLCLFSYIFLLTCINRAVSYSYLCKTLGEAALVVYITSNIRKKPGELVASFEGALLILYVLDIISVIICLITGDHSNDSFGLVGHKNYHAFLFIMTIGFRLLSNRLNREKLFDSVFWVLAIVSIAAEFIVDSASGAAGILLMVFLCLLMTKKSLPFVNMTFFICVLLAINIFVLFFMKNSKLAAAVLSMMGRDIGLTGRSKIWDEAVRIFLENPVFGYGYYKQVYLYFVGHGWLYNHCHNFFLNLLLSGGVIYAVIMIAFLFVIARHLRLCNTESGRIVTYMLTCYLLLGLTEIVVNVNTMLFPLLTIGFYCMYLKDDSNTN